MSVETIYRCDKCKRQIDVPAFDEPITVYDRYYDDSFGYTLTDELHFCSEKCKKEYNYRGEVSHDQKTPSEERD